MAELVQRMQRNERLIETKGEVRVFGIRHLSPGGAYHLRAFLDEVLPTAVLVEGPSDASGFIQDIVSRNVTPPIAILAYTNQLPIRTLVFPLASYSPEYQAFQWATEHRVHCEFIDLPSDKAVALHNKRNEGREAAAEKEGESSTRLKLYYKDQHNLYAQVAELSGESDYEAFWERHFEHNLLKDAYREAIYVYSAQMRELAESSELANAPYEAAYNEIREAYMRRQIHNALSAGHSPERIVVITGAHHASAMQLTLPIMTDEELEQLLHWPTKLTLMPYSYYKLSNQSGYGAGNLAPAYYEMMWTCMQTDSLGRLPALYLARLASFLRDEGTSRSTAAVIEGVRLAESLASLHGGSMPTWRDLRDAAIVCFGYGELSVIARALARTDVGTAIGSLPEGVSQTPVQDDVNRHLKRLKLEKYKSTVATDLELDLRENRRVQAEEAAFLDLNRSIFLHRLQVLHIDFAKKKMVHQESATWAEHWVLQWTPEVEIQTVESTLKGETIELAAAFEIKELIEVCPHIGEASRIIRLACECGLPESMEQARVLLQELAVDAGNFKYIALAAHELSILIHYGDIRKLNTDSLIPLLQQLFLKGSLLLNDAAVCNDEASNEIISAINMMHTISKEHFAIVDDELWLQKLDELASRDDRNARLSGLTFAILLERNRVSNEQCAQEVSRRLSPGIPADLGAGWFEGLSMRNRYALLSRAALWEQLDQYIRSLEGIQFQRSLVFLRRAFGSFEAREKVAIAEILGELWGTGADETGDILHRPLNEVEKGKLDELNDFDFGDF